MAILSWLDGEGRSLVGRCVQEQKQREVWLAAEQWASDSKPSRLTLKEDVSKVVARGLKMWNRDLVNQDFPVVHDGSVLRSSRAWLASANGPSRQARYHIEDDVGSPRSSSLWVTNKRAVVETGGEVSAKRLGVRARIWHTVCRVKACEDPDFDVVLMLPWESGRADLIDFAAKSLEHYLPDVDGRIALSDTGQGFFEPEPPPGWHFSIFPERLSLIEGETAEVTVQFETSGQTAFPTQKVAFAVQIVETGEEEGVVSQIFEVNVPAF